MKVKFKIEKDDEVHVVEMRKVSYTTTNKKVKDDWFQVYIDGYRLFSAFPHIGGVNIHFNHRDTDSNNPCYVEEIVPHCDSVIIRANLPRGEKVGQE